MQKKQQQKQNNKKWHRIVYWSLFAVILLYTLFATRFNIISYWQTKRANRQLKETIAKITSENEELQKQIEELRTDPEAWERIAREKYGMQKEDEKVIIFRQETD